jgi:lysophospholipase L1-like esterase
MRTAMIFLSCLLTTIFAFAAEPVLSPGDTVVFLGDSITEQRLYTRYVEEYALMRFPDWKLCFINVGWGGDRTAKACKRIERDVLSHKPDVVTHCFGMNDGFYREIRQDDLDLYLNGYKSIFDQLDQAGAKSVLITNGVVDPLVGRKRHKTYNKKLRLFADASLELARERGYPAYDMFSPFYDTMLRLRKENPDTHLFWGHDEIHPSPPGHLVMAYGLLKALNMPALVSSVEIKLDAETAKANTNNCKVKKLRFKDSALTFTRQDSAWPWYIDDECAFVLDLLPIMEEFNQYTLKVKNLPGRNYRIEVDGEALGEYSASELAKGVNLARTNGPWIEAGKKLAELSTEKSKVYLARWRRIQLETTDSKGKKATLRTMDRWIEYLQKEMRKTAKPKATEWVIISL